MNPDSNTPAVAAPIATLPTPAAPVTAAPVATPVAKANLNPVKTPKPFGNKKARFAAAAPKL